MRSRLRSSPRDDGPREGHPWICPWLPPGASDGQAPQPSIEDRVRQLHRVSPVVSPRTEVRLNLLVPTVDAGRTYGGIRTALDLFEAMGTAVAERRIVAVTRGSSTVGEAIPAFASIEGGADPALPLQSVDVSRPGSELAVRRGDVFVATYWTTAELVRAYPPLAGDDLRPRAGAVRVPDPGLRARLLPMVGTVAPGAGDLRRAGRDDGHLQHVDAKRLLPCIRHQIRQEYAFEPRMLPELRAAMAAPPVPRTRMILIYGRPGTPRNAFPAIVDGLRAWRARHPNADDWHVVSIGRAHPNIPLGDGATLRSVGKLDLEAYARLLRQAAVGISMMVSPHPSYPPLEMAYLGDAGPDEPVRTEGSGPPGATPGRLPWLLPGPWPPWPWPWPPWPPPPPWPWPWPWPWPPPGSSPDHRHQQAPPAGLRPADDLLPAGDPGGHGHPRGHGHRRRQERGRRRRAARRREHFGLDLTYRYQRGALGIAHAIGLARDFVGDDELLLRAGRQHPARRAAGRRGCRLRGRTVGRGHAALPGRPTRGASASPSSTPTGPIVGFEEKPERPKSDLIPIGVYFLRPDAFDVIEHLAPSGRGEFEITDVLNHYIPGGGLFSASLRRPLVGRGHRRLAPAGGPFRRRGRRRRQARSATSAPVTADRLAPGAGARLLVTGGAGFIGSCLRPRRAGGRIRRSGSRSSTC